MNILIVSGFLGAGKTTFIKELIRRTGTNPVILENEYGDNSIDAQELRSSDSGSDKKGKLEVLEFMEGCVCCTMKDSFVNSVLTVFSGLSPEYLIVEPTGVGQLSKIIDNLKPILHENIRLLQPVAIVAPRSYRQNMSEWEVLYKDQIANAGTIVFSKCENDSPELLSQTESEIREINADAEIVSRHYTSQSEEWWRNILSLPSSDVSAKAAEGKLESFSQITINNAKLDNPAELIVLLEDCLRGSLGNIVRAKGTIPVGSETLRFDLADSLYSITSSDQEANQCVFIGESLNKDDIIRRLGSTPQMPKWNAPNLSGKSRL
ncbi:MAG: GTP-binding protein [Butyrivibrio sp.]|nr:GTP-binding protein [Butyrivibrio sp.]